MANITQPRDPRAVKGVENFYEPVAASTKLIKGAMVGRNASGFIVNMESGTPATALGECLKTVDNTSGSDGDKYAEIRSGVFNLHIAGADSFVRADIDAFPPVYALDNQTVAKTSNGGARPVMGRVIGIEGGMAQVIVGLAALASLPDGDLVAANNLSDVAAAATARANIGANVGFLNARVPLNAAGVFYLPLPKACTIIDLRSAVEGDTTANGAATVTAALDTTNITNGVITIASGAVVGEKDSATPSAANVATEGQNLRLTVATNGQDAAAFAHVSVEFTY